jgi:hypothetical protein
MFVDEAHTRNLTREFFVAGSDTVCVYQKPRAQLADSYNSIKSVSAMSSLVLALALYPQVQKQAQAELDLVVGRDRLPTFDDRPRLPYIKAICRELLRWQMVSPIGSNIRNY